MDYTQMAVAGLNTLGQVAAQSMALSENKHAMKRQFGLQMDMAKWQNDINRENWQLQNEYNSPAAQMARLQEAGLNPNLVYNGGSATTAAGSMAPAANPGVPGIPDYGRYAQNMASSMSGLLDQALKAANIEKVAQETDNLKTYQRSMVTDIQHKELLNIFQNYANAKTQAEAEIWADLLDERLIGMRANNFLTDSKRFLTDVQKEYIKGPQTANTESSTARNIGEVALMQYRKQVMLAQVQDLLASSGLKSVTANKVTYEIANLVADYQLKGVTLTSKQLENDLTEILKTTGINLRGGGQLQPLMNLVFGLFQQAPRAAKEVNEFVNPF